MYILQGSTEDDQEELFIYPLDDRIPPEWTETPRRIPNSLPIRESDTTDQEGA